MAEEEREGTQEARAEKSQKGGKKLLIMIPILSLVLGVGGFAGYKFLLNKDKGHETQEAHLEGPSVMVPLAPFVINLDGGRFLKFTVQLELLDAKLKEEVKEKIPQVRDTIIMLVSNRSPQSVSSPEGKFQLKDEILLRVNQVMGLERDTFKNVYFTEFVMQ